MDKIELGKMSQEMMDILRHPYRYKIEVCAKALDVLKITLIRLQDMEKDVEVRIIEELQDNKSTELQFENLKGEKKVLKICEMKTLILGE